MSTIWKYLHYEAPRDDRVSHILAFTLGGSASLACTVHGLGTQEIQRPSMSHMDDMIGMMAYLENILMAVTIGGGIVLKDRVIT